MMQNRWNKGLICGIAVCAAFLFVSVASAQYPARPSNIIRLDLRLISALHQAGFTGKIESSLQSRIGHPVDGKLADVGRFLWYDKITGLNNDNTCAGCHSPTNGFGDTQSIAIGIQNNGVVGPHRAGPRNMRRSPMVINTAFYPNLMWNSRFISLSGDPFDNRAGFLFPQPEGSSLSYLPHLLVAQAFIPPTERTEAAGFEFQGDNYAIRTEVMKRINNIPAYRDLFGEVFPEVKAGNPISYDMFAKAIAEFEFTLVFANAPIDQYARGDNGALSKDEKKGALLFFGKAGCSVCHRVSGPSNEMFSDFKDHVVGVPQIVPRVTNNTFDGPSSNEDFGREEITNDPRDRYKFRTSPLRNVALQPTFMHNGAFTSLEDAIRYHLNAVDGALQYTPAGQHLAADLTGPMGPIQPVLAHLDPILATPIHLTKNEFQQLVAFVRCGLLDPRAKPENLLRLVPQAVPSGSSLFLFEFPATSEPCH